MQLLKGDAEGWPHASGCSCIHPVNFSLQHLQVCERGSFNDCRAIVTAVSEPAKKEVWPGEWKSLNGGLSSGFPEFGKAISAALEVRIEHNFETGTIGREFGDGSLAPLR